MIEDKSTWAQKIAQANIHTLIIMPKFACPAQATVLTLICILTFARTVGTLATMPRKDNVR